jgi:predicted transglutaminase-like cysteine proteinase
MLSLTNERWRQLETVQGDINARVGYRTDLALYGAEELWTVADRQGDCEDYALAKRQALLALGWPVSSLRLAVCTVPGGEGHAVLSVDTNRGVYVLDNRHPFVEPWASLPYTWIKRQAASGPGWVEITA